MIYDNYSDLPVKIFFKILSDESKVELLSNGSQVDEEVLKTTWLEIKDDYLERNPPLINKKTLSSKQLLVKMETLLKRNKLILDRITMFTEDKEVFLKEYGFSSVESLKKEIDKGEKKVKIERARLKKQIDAHLENKDGGDKKPFGINEALAHLKLSLSGKNFPVNFDPDKITCGEYDYYVEFSKKLKKPNGR